MNEETFNMSIRKFLKNVGVRSQGEIERAVAREIAAGNLRGDETLTASVRLSVAGISLDLTMNGEIRLE